MLAGLLCFHLLFRALIAQCTASMPLRIALWGELGVPGHVTTVQQVG